MNKNQMKTAPRPAKKTILSPSVSNCLFGSLAFAAVLPAGVATCRADGAASRTDAIVNFEFSDKYLTPRGMIVHNSGLAFQTLVLGLFNVYKNDDAFINNVTLVPGIWNDFSSQGVAIHPPFGSKPRTDWVEIDPIAGISLGLPKHFKLDVTYTAFNMQILDIGQSQHLDTKLSFDDSDYLKAYALHPYVEFWQELDGKATAADVPYLVDPLSKHLGSGPGSSYYFETGIAPSYTFEKSGLKLELPCRVLLPCKDFYGEYYHSASTVGLYEVGIKGTIPLKFMPEGYGHWSFHAGFKYMKFVDKNLQEMQAFNAPEKSVADTVQVYAGIQTFF